MSENSPTTTPVNQPRTLAPLTAIERRILGVLMEKARSTPDSYPLSLNALTLGCNQKSNRAPLMNLTEQQVEDAVFKMRHKQLVAEVHGGGRVPKFRHLGYDYLQVKGVDAAVMTELLLRGEQTLGELRTRAGRFEQIADLTIMQQIVDALTERGLVITLTPAGRGQLLSHNLYLPDELQSLKDSLQSQTSGDGNEAGFHEISAKRTSAAPQVSTEDFEQLKEELRELKSLVEQLQERITLLES